MKSSEIRARLKPWILPIAMVVGFLFHDSMEPLAWTAPWLIFAMLLLTFCKVKPEEFRITPLSRILIPVQILGGISLYFVLHPLSESLAQGMFICVFCPTATAAPVIVGLLGGSVPRLATFSILSNMVVALLAPPIFTLIGTDGVEFMPTFLTIAAKVIPLIVGPLVLAFVLLRCVPKVHHQLANRASLSFYMWAFSLIIVVGRAVSFVMREPARVIPLMVALGIGAGVVCVLQFFIGRQIGGQWGDKIAGAQGLAQKNTVLAIWMAMTFMNPICSVAPAAYILWQNTINSVQLYLHDKNLKRN
ncbi:MAG: transporter [Muribaculaceae bacterium]|nr:transporter [Muribaculaceae bacterium]